MSLFAPTHACRPGCGCVPRRRRPSVPPTCLPGPPKPTFPGPSQTRAWQRLLPPLPFRATLPLLCPAPPSCCYLHSVPWGRGRAPTRLKLSSVMHRLNYNSGGLKGPLSVGSERKRGEARGDLTARGRAARRGTMKQKLVGRRVGVQQRSDTWQGGSQRLAGDVGLQRRGAASLLSPTVQRGAVPTRPRVQRKAGEETSSGVRMRACPLHVLGCLHHLLKGHRLVLAPAMDACVGQSRFQPILAHHVWSCHAAAAVAAAAAAAEL